MEESFKVQGNRQGSPAYIVPNHLWYLKLPSYCLSFKRKGMKTLSINTVSPGSCYLMTFGEQVRLEVVNPPPSPQPQPWEERGCPCG